METLYLIAGLLWAIISIIMIVKFFQMSSDLKALRNHFTPNINSHVVEPAHDPMGRITGVINANGIKYTVVGGSVEFSDGNVGCIKPLQYGKYSVQTEGGEEVCADVYYAAEILYDFLSKKR